MRRPHLARLPTRTPSLSRDSSSSSSSANTTPRSNTSLRLGRSSTASPLPAASVPLPRSNTASPAVAPFVEEEDITDELGPRGVDAYPPLPDDDSMDLDMTNPAARQRPSPFSQRYFTNKSSSSIGQNDDVREPTFSSEDTPAMTRLADDFSHNHSIRNLGVHSPAPSSTFSVTPIPARPRARFAMSVQPPPDMDVTNSEQSVSEKQQTMSVEESTQNDKDGASQHEESEDSVDVPTPTANLRQARFSTPVPDEDNDASLGITPMPNRLRMAPRFETPIAGDQGDLLTPRTRRKSFLLSVINSNARPRPKAAGTPHPHGKFTSLTTPRAGATPYAPRSISQQHPDMGASESEADTDTSPDAASSVAGAGPGSVSNAAATTWTPRARTFTSGSLAGGNFASPYESDRASYVSTASSHDLTIHARANASFDAVTVGQQGGLNRVNASKLNQYLYSLNTRLKEENEELLERLRLSETSKGQVSSVESGSGTSRRLSGGSGRGRSSIGGSVLGDVEEELSAEMWAEEKRQLEEALEELKEELQLHQKNREQAEAALKETEAALEDEQNERTKDKDRWRSRMGEVESGVSEIIKDLENKMRNTEERAKAAERAREEDAKAFERKLRDLETEKEFALDRAGKAERVLENERELGGDLKSAHEKLGQAMTDAHDADARIAQLEDELAHANERVGQLETEKTQNRATIASLEQDIKARESEYETMEEQLKAARAQVSSMEGELRITKEYVTELEGDASKAAERMEAIHGELESLEEHAEQLRTELEAADEQFGALEDEKERATELARQLEDALEAAETKMKGDETNIQRLQDQVTTLERGLERERQRPNSSRGHRSRDEPTADVTDVEALEEELDAAHREIARLSTLLQDSPARAAINKAKDLKIELLEKEKEDLLERVQSLKSTSLDFQTPSKITNASGISPLHRQLMNMRTWSPKTPGPIKEVCVIKLPSVSVH
jgi:hypothetical protein